MMKNLFQFKMKGQKVMKKSRFILILLMLMASLLVACSNGDTSKEKNANEAEVEGNTVTENKETKSETVTYESETGPIEVPANPQRIVALSNGPNVHTLEGKLVGVDEWTKANPLFSEELENVEVVSENEPESILAQEPDLIIAGSHMENLEELQKIAPTVIYTWGKLDYLEQQLEIGKLLSKEEEAQEWVDDFSQRAEEVGDKIKAKHGEDVTVTVFETESKNFYVFGDNWARGTEVIYQAMGLTMPEKVEEDVRDEGYSALSLEVLGEYAGDFVVVSRNEGDNAFMDSDMWKAIPAVENNQVIEIDTKASTYSDPITLEYLLAIFEKGFLES